MHYKLFSIASINSDESANLRVFWLAIAIVVAINNYSFPASNLEFLATAIGKCYCDLQ